MPLLLNAFQRYKTTFPAARSPNFTVLDAKVTKLAVVYIIINSVSMVSFAFVFPTFTVVYGVARKQQLYLTSLRDSREVSGTTPGPRAPLIHSALANVYRK